MSTKQAKPQEQQKPAVKYYICLDCKRILTGKEAPYGKPCIYCRSTRKRARLPEDKGKKLMSQQNFLDFLHDDITWCTESCDNDSCERNRTRMRNPFGMHSFASFKGTDTCPLTRSEKEEHKHESK